MASATTKTDPPPASAASTRLQRAKVNAMYLALGSGASVAPASFATRSALNTTRYALRYIIRRLLRYAKYAAVGAVAAVLGTTVLGTLGSGLAFFAAPGLLGGAGIGLATALAKFGWRHRGNYFRGGVFAEMKQRAEAGSDPAKDEAADIKHPKEQSGTYKKEDVFMRV